MSRRPSVYVLFPIVFHRCIPHQTCPTTTAPSGLLPNMARHSARDSNTVLVRISVKMELHVGWTPPPSTSAITVREQVMVETAALISIRIFARAAEKAAARAARTRAARPQAKGEKEARRTMTHRARCHGTNGHSDHRFQMILIRSFAPLLHRRGNREARMTQAMTGLSIILLKVCRCVAMSPTFLP